MSREIKAIETHYKGYRFRSRLEARWAVFFDTAEIKWEYEPEGYVLSSGKCYLPDFYLPDMDIFVEIKGEKPDQEDKNKLVLFRTELNKSILLLTGILELEQENYLLCKALNEDDIFIKIWQSVKVARHLLYKNALIFDMQKSDNGIDNSYLRFMDESYTIPRYYIENYSSPLSEDPLIQDLLLRIANKTNESINAMKSARFDMAKTSNKNEQTTNTRATTKNEKANSSENEKMKSAQPKPKKRLIPRTKKNGEIAFKVINDDKPETTFEHPYLEEEKQLIAYMLKNHDLVYKVQELLKGFIFVTEEQQAIFTYLLGFYEEHLKFDLSDFLTYLPNNQLRKIVASIEIIKEEPSEVDLKRDTRKIIKYQKLMQIKESKKKKQK